MGKPPWHTDPETREESGRVPRRQPGWQREQQTWFREQREGERCGRSFASASRGKEGRASPWQGQG